jgi:ribosomal protein S12 methylthiotransferase
VALVSLGCPKNQVDSELILGRLERAGAEIVEDVEAADTLVINTCAFIDRAREESVEALLEAAAWKERRPGRRIVAAGCLVQRSGEELAAELPEIDSYVGLDGIRGLSVPSPSPGSDGRIALPAAPPPSEPATALFDHLDPRRRLSPPWSAYVKIAEGCNQTCAFCAIPSFRGRMRSRPLDDLLAELEALAREGVVEANLIAQDSTSYGRDLDMRDGLAELVRAAGRAETAPPWIRVHYLYPGRISSGLLEALAGADRIVPYIDLPLQHADPEVLRRMRRPGDAESYLRQLEHLRKALPGAATRSGFIVGFPGETEQAFERLCAFVLEAGFDSVGVFTYSHEEGTHAGVGSEDDVPAELKEERRQRLEEICADVAHERALQRVGDEIEVLVEGETEDVPGALEGRWAGQSPEIDGRVLLEGAAGAAPGELVRARVTDGAPGELVTVSLDR